MLKEKQITSSEYDVLYNKELELFKIEIDNINPIKIYNRTPYSYQYTTIK
jgi:hypothetical protein